MGSPLCGGPTLPFDFPAREVVTFDDFLTPLLSLGMEVCLSLVVESIVRRVVQADSVCLLANETW